MESQGNHYAPQLNNASAAKRRGFNKEDKSKIPFSMPHSFFFFCQRWGCSAMCGPLTALSGRKTKRMTAQNGGRQGYHEGRGPFDVCRIVPLKELWEIGVFEVNNAAPIETRRGVVKHNPQTTGQSLAVCWAPSLCGTAGNCSAPNSADAAQNNHSLNECFTFHVSDT